MARQTPVLCFDDCGVARKLCDDERTERLIVEEVHHRGDASIFPLPPVGRHLFEHGTVDRGVDRIEKRFHHRDEQRALGVEVAIRKAGRYACALGDRRELHRALACDDFGTRGLENAFASRLTARGSRRGSGSKRGHRAVK